MNVYILDDLLQEVPKLLLGHTPELPLVQIPLEVIPATPTLRAVAPLVECPLHRTTHSFSPTFLYCISTQP